MALHQSGEDYLEAILVLQKQRGMVRSVDVARHMAVSKPSVCHAVATLKEGGFLTMDEDFSLHLTDVGQEVAEQIYEKHRFFTDRLIAAGVDPETAERDACRIEHVISEESFRRLKAVAEPESSIQQKEGAVRTALSFCNREVIKWTKSSSFGPQTRTAVYLRQSLMR